MMRPSPLLAFVAVLAASAVRAQQESLKVGKFFNPPNAIDGPADYSTNPVWTLGEVQTIKFTTTYSNYTIDLWQESPAGNSASAGPSIFQTRSGAVTQFDWSVQAFEFDLSEFNVFFLWLSPLTTDDPNPLSVTSRYFNITRAPASSTISSTSSTASSSSTGAPSSSNTSPPASSATHSTTPVPVASQTPAASTGLSAGASAGIGVGAALLVIALVAGGCFLWKRRRNHDSYQAQAAAGTMGPGPGPNGIIPEMPDSTQFVSAQKPPLYPVELDSGGGYPPHYYHQPVRFELDGFRRSELDGSH
ncbi:uncharacterized protein F4812DRAFT_458116 [Daldinia caldariorum]|uniref:uncharacterized protein n=1 Tax=Daldinia caldariorum TaxID=326644 RepID=UPI00200840FE|nr:uncharacterized protein F4812DRAFT_458116 [Daldinia caldariorum]KAI1469582.1 hypothetical protein F4812DRAFT_458116 [Daldinia caldariorum]